MRKLLSALVFLVILTLLMLNLACGAPAIPEQPKPPEKVTPTTSEEPSSDWVKIAPYNYIRYYYDETHGVCIWVVEGIDKMGVGVLPAVSVRPGTKENLNLEIIGADE